MYSMVLMMAMTASPAVPASGWGSCSGCSGEVVTSCSGCSGSSCHGCCGGGGFLGLRGMFKKHGCCGGETSCSGCCGGETSCHGCSGASCHGCSGSSCHGCCGGSGGFLGFGLFKKKHGCCGGETSCNGCSGSSCMGCLGGEVVVPEYPSVINGGTIDNSHPPVVETPKVIEEKKIIEAPKKEMPKEIETPKAPKELELPKVEPKVTEKKVMAPAKATIIVSVPASTKLIVDGVATQATSAVRTFETPELAMNQTYFYNFTAEINQDGQIFSTSQKVAVKAGEVTNVVLNPTIGLTSAK
jgi:uncharacterized protein (TIGR03000 family)